MRLLLCHECFFWVPAEEGRCPECHHVIDSAVPDPPVDLLDRLIGPVLRPLGDVRLRREYLPEQGTLYETAHGLYFVPHQVRRTVEMVEVAQAGRSLLWTLASLAFAPLIVVLPFMRFRKLQAQEVPVFEPRRLSAREQKAPGELLMDNPGTFFVPRTSIRRLRRRRNRWVVERRFGSSLNFFPLDEARSLHREMTELLRSDRWFDLAAC